DVVVFSCQCLQAFTQIAAVLGGLVDQVLFLDHLQGGESGGAGHRVGSVGAALGTGASLGHQALGGGHGGQWITAGQSLGGDHHVRLDAGMLVAPEAAGTAV